MTANSLSEIFSDAEGQLTTCQRPFWMLNDSQLLVRGDFGRSMAAYSMSLVFMDGQ